MHISRIKTSRLTLEPLTLSDGWLMWRTFKTPGFTNGLYYDGPVTLWFALKKVFTSLGHQYSIRRSRKPIGRVWLIEKRGKWRLGYWLMPDAQGEGYMRESVAALLKVAPQLIDQDLIHAECHAWNNKSRSVLLASGFYPVGLEENREQYVFDFSNSHS